MLGNGSELIVGEVDQIKLLHGIFRIHQEAEPEKGSENAVITVPADLPEAKREQIRETAKSIYMALGCEGLARVDMFLQEDGRIVLNEVNTLPGFTSYSRYPRMMAAAGIGLSERDRSLHLVGDGAVSMEAGFVFLDDVLSGVRWDAKYATWDNFTGTPVDGYEVNRIVGSLALADALLRAKTRAAALGFGLLLWDGYRPQRAVNRFLEWSAQPEDGRTKRAVLSQHRPGRDVHERVRRAEVRPQPGKCRRPHALPTGHRGACCRWAEATTSWMSAHITGHEESRASQPRIAGACVPSWSTAGSNGTTANGGTTR